MLLLLRKYGLLCRSVIACYFLVFPCIYFDLSTLPLKKFYHSKGIYFTHREICKDIIIVTAGSDGLIKLWNLKPEAPNWLSIVGQFHCNGGSITCLETISITQNDDFSNVVFEKPIKKFKKDRQLKLKDVGMIVGGNREGTIYFLNVTKPNI